MPRPRSSAFGSRPPTSFGEGGGGPVDGIGGIAGVDYVPGVAPAAPLAPPGGVPYGARVPVPVYEAADPQADRGIALGLQAGWVLVPRDMIAVTEITGSVSDGSSATLDFSSEFRRLTDARGGRASQWVLYYAQVSLLGSGTGPFVFDEWRAGPEDLGLDIAAEHQQIPLGYRLPVPWDGRFSVRCTNRTNAAAQAFLTLFLGRP